MIIVYQNNFNNIVLNSSILANFQKYSPPVPLPDNFNFVMNPISKVQIFKGYNSVFQVLFDMTVLKITPFQPQGITFFLDFENNTLLDISSNNGTVLIEASDLSLVGTIVTILYNTFSRVVISTDKSFDLIGISEVTSAIVQMNSMVNITGKGNSLSVTSSTINLLLIDSNWNNNFNQTASYYIQSAICTVITIHNDTTLNISSESSWMQIDCGLFIGNITIQTSSFQNMLVSSTPGKLLALNFIRINVQKTSKDVGMGNVTITDSVFSNITLSKTRQGFIKGVFKNPMLLFTLSNTNILLYNNVFKSFQNYPDDKIMSISAPTIMIDTCNFLNITYYEPTGGMNLLFNTMTLKNTDFVQCYGVPSASAGGLMNLINPKIGSTEQFELIIINSKFIRNMAPKATLINVQNSAINIQVQNSVFADNFILSSDAVGTGIISMQSMFNSSLQFQSTTFQLSCVYSTSSIATFIQVNKPTSNIAIAISDSLLYVNSSFAGNFFSLSRGQLVNLAISNLTYSTGALDLSPYLYPSSNYSTCSGSSSYGLLLTDAVNANFDNLKVIGLKIVGLPLFQLSRTPYNSLPGYVNFSNSNFSGLEVDSNIMKITNADSYCDLSVTITNTEFSKIKSTSSEGGTVVENFGSASLKALNVSASTFQNISAVKGGVFYGPPPFNFKSNTFNTISVQKEGGVFYGVEGTSSNFHSRMLAAPPMDFSLSGNTFTGISATDGGVFYSTGSWNMLLQDNTFNTISASDRGAVLYLDDSYVSATGNKFESTTAGISGSIIYQTKINSQFSISQFNSDNTIQGANNYSLAMSPNHLNVKIIPIDANETTVDWVIEDYNATNTSTFIIRNLTSYSLGKFNFSITVVYKDDQTEQVVADDSDSNSMTFTFNFKDLDPKTYFNYECTSSSCLFTAGEIQMVGKAYDIFPVKMVFNSKSYEVTDTFYIQLRECVVGEINDTLNDACSLCKENTYSLDVKDPSCKECPANAKCNGGANIEVKSGYWRNSTSSPRIVACNDSDSSRCLGGFTSECDPQYVGPFCLQCNFKQGYLSIGEKKCASCPSEKSLVATGVLFLIGTMIYQLFVQYTTFRDNSKIYLESLEPTEGPMKVRPGAYIVILTTYSQISSIIGKMNSGYMTELIGVSIVIANPNAKVLFSLECLYALYNPEADYALRFKIAFFVFSPLVKLALFALGQLLFFIFVKKTQERKQKELMRLGVAAVVLIMLEQPGIVGVLCDYLACKRLDPADPATYIATNSNISCDTASYAWYRNSIVIPALLIWGFLVPGAILGIMFKNRKNLFQSRKIRTIFGTYYNNYAPRVFYWGIVNIYFKIIMFVLDSVLTLDELGKCLILLIVIHCFFALFKRKSPYSNKSLYVADLLTIMSFLCTLTLIFMKNLSDQDGLRRFYDVVVILANAAPIVYLLFKLLQLYTAKLRATLNKKGKEKKPKKVDAVQSALDEVRKSKKIKKEEKISAFDASLSAIDEKNLSNFDLMKSNRGLKADMTRMDDSAFNGSHLADLTMNLEPGSSDKSKQDNQSEHSVPYPARNNRIFASAPRKMKVENFMSKFDV